MGNIGTLKAGPTKHRGRIYWTSLDEWRLTTAERIRDSRLRDALVRQIETLNRQIDQLVYNLYGLTEEEIRIVEEATG